MENIIVFDIIIFILFNQIFFSEEQMDGQVVGRSRRWLCAPYKASEFPE